MSSNRTLAPHPSPSDIRRQSNGQHTHAPERGHHDIVKKTPARAGYSHHLPIDPGDPGKTTKTSTPNKIPNILSARDSKTHTPTPSPNRTHTRTALMLIEHSRDKEVHWDRTGTDNTTYMTQKGAHKISIYKVKKGSLVPRRDEKN